ncbi:MAG: hypothetical protein ABF651_05540 [Sporolactobacillus sp.]
MNFKELGKKIEKTEYWDMPILDVQTRYFGDEVYIYIEKTERICWRISFLSCYKVDYETDANWRNMDSVGDMRGGQLGYFGQDFSVSQNEKNSNFVDVSIDLSIMTMKIICKDILVEEVSTDEVRFFWQEDTK